MAGGYTTEDQAMQSGAVAVETAATAISGQLAKLSAEVEEMFGGWDSDAQRAFAALHETWSEQQTRLKVALDNMHRALVRSNENYQAQEESQSDLFRKINPGG